MTMTKRKQRAKSNMEKAARAFGYQGPMSQLEKYKKSDPVFARKMAMVQDKLNMRKGGVVKLSEGGGRVGNFGAIVDPGYQKSSCRNFSSSSR